MKDRPTLADIRFRLNVSFAIVFIVGAFCIIALTTLIHLRDPNTQVDSPRLCVQQAGVAEETWNKH